MDGIDQLTSLNFEYMRGVIQPQDYKHNLVALLRSFTEDELVRFANLIARGDESIHETGH